MLFEGWAHNTYIINDVAAAYRELTIKFDRRKKKYARFSDSSFKKKCCWQVVRLFWFAFIFYSNEFIRMIDMRVS